MVQAVVEIGQAVGIESELVQDGGVQLLDLETVFDGGAADLVGFSVADAAFDSTAALALVSMVVISVLYFAGQSTKGRPR